METNLKKQNYDVIIIGGGLGGLSCGAMLTQQGKKVLLLEQHYIPGGCATTFKRKDYVMEVGLHELDGLDNKDKKTKIFKELGILDKVEFLRLPQFHEYRDEDINITIPEGTEEAKKVLIDRFPDEKKGIKKYFKVINRIRNEFFYLPTQNWLRIVLAPLFPILFPYLTVSSSRLLHLVALINPLFWLRAPQLILWKHRTIGSFLESNIKDENLKKVLLTNLVYYHDNPETMSLIYWAIGQAGYYKSGWFIKGGSQKLSNHLSNVIDQNGGKVLLGKKVTEIIVEDNKAVGVKYKDTFNSHLPEVSLFSSKVIGNAAPQQVAKMLPPNLRLKMENKFSNLKESCSLLTIFIGFKKEPKDLGSNVYSTFFGGEGVKKMKDIHEKMNGSWEERTWIFVDYSQIDAELAPIGKSFGTICAVDYMSNWDNLSKEEYKLQKEEVGKVLFNRLEKHLPGITEEIECYEIATPKTIQRYTLTPKGTPYGFDLKPSQSGIYRLLIDHVPVKNLHLSSVWGFPGHGFTGAMLSGHNCSTQLKSLKPKTDLQPVATTENDDRIVRLIEKREIANNTVELVFEKPTGFVYDAGQYVVLDILKPKYEELDMPIRMLSIVSHPDEDNLRFAMRLSESSFKKSVNEMNIGEESRLFGPMGDFSIKTDDKDIVLLVSGIGITPILPLLKELEKNKYDRSIYLFYSNKTKEETAYLEELESFQNLDYKCLTIFTKIQDRINEEFLVNELKSLNQYDYYVVGTSSFTESMEGILTQNQVDKKDIKVDDFG